MAEPRSTKPLPAQRRVPTATVVVTVLLACYWTALFYGTHIKIPPDLLPEARNIDKLAHLASYAVLGALFMSLRATRGVYPWSSVIARWFVLAGYGAFDEISQLLVNRNADPMDWLADVIGVAVGLGSVTFVVWRFRRSTNPAHDDAHLSKILPS